MALWPIVNQGATSVSEFFRNLQAQRWDDHRYYHQSRINQALHFVSALSFLAAYAMLFIDPAWAAWIGWGVRSSTQNRREAPRGVWAGTPRKRPGTFR